MFGACMHSRRDRCKHDDVVLINIHYDDWLMKSSRYLYKKSKNVTHIAKVAVTFMVRTGSAAVWADQIFSWNDALPTFLSHRAGPSPEKSVHFQDPILRTDGRPIIANLTIFRPDPLHAHTLGRIQAAPNTESASGPAGSLLFLSWLFIASNLP